jgi:carbamoyltransferase
MGTELDVLVIGNLLLLKEDQDPTLRETYQDHYELD